MLIPLVLSLTWQERYVKLLPVKVFSVGIAKTGKLLIVLACLGKVVCSVGVF